MALPRRQFLQSAFAPLARASSASTRQPNFLILLADQHSPHVAGCYGDPIVRTPHLDALARRGVVFEHAYCQSPLCVPSRMSLLSGRQPSSIGVWDNGDTLASDIPTFAHALGAAGYETALIGRMHFQGPDAWHGFERLLVGNLTPVYAHVPHALPPALLVGAQGNSRASVTLAGPGHTAYQAHDTQVAAAAAGFLREKARQPGRPFCAVAGFILPHAPLICPRPEWDYYLDRVSLPQVPPGYFERLHPTIALGRRNVGLDNLSPTEVRRARAGYYGLVTELDRMVGEVLEALRSSGLDRDTIVLYASDHGEMAGENGLWWKTSFYEASAGVPLIVSCPERFPAGRRAAEVVSLVDIAPTLLELAGAPGLPGATGASLVPLLRGGAPRWPNEAFSELAPVYGLPPRRMIRSGRWKLVHIEGQRPQLFDLEADPHEFNDQGESQAHAAIRGELHGRVLAGWSAATLEAGFRQRQRNHALLNRWAETVRPPTPNQWYAPAGANRFPEPGSR